MSHTLNRQGKKIKVSLMPVEDQTGDYKLGIWVRDDTQGIGTLTYVDAAGNYGALGHGISDVDTGELLSITGGSLYKTQILGIQKGSKGNPGELSGLIRYNVGNVLGSITKNTANGIYGKYQSLGGDGIALKEMKNDGRVNVVGRISDDERFLLEFLKPWSSFKLIENK